MSHPDLTWCVLLKVGGKFSFTPAVFLWQLLRPEKAQVLWVTGKLRSGWLNAGPEGFVISHINKLLGLMEVSKVFI